MPGFGEDAMNEISSKTEEYRRLVQHILEVCPGTSRRQAEVIAKRMMEQPDGDLLDQMSV